MAGRGRGSCDSSSLLYCHELFEKLDGKQDFQCVERDVRMQNYEPDQFSNADGMPRLRDVARTEEPSDTTAAIPSVESEPDRSVAEASGRHDVGYTCAAEHGASPRCDPSYHVAAMGSACSDAETQAKHDSDTDCATLDTRSQSRDPDQDASNGARHCIDPSSLSLPTSPLEFGVGARSPAVHDGNDDDAAGAAVHGESPVQHTSAPSWCSMRSPGDASCAEKACAPQDCDHDQPARRLSADLNARTSPMQCHVEASSDIEAQGADDSAIASAAVHARNLDGNPDQDGALSCEYEAESAQSSRTDDNAGTTVLALALALSPSTDPSPCIDDDVDDDDDDDDDDDVIISEIVTEDHLDESDGEHSSAAPAAEREPEIGANDSTVSDDEPGKLLRSPPAAERHPDIESDGGEAQSKPPASAVADDVGSGSSLLVNTTPLGQWYAAELAKSPGQPTAQQHAAGPVVRDASEDDGVKITRSGSPSGHIVAIGPSRTQHTTSDGPQPHRSAIGNAKPGGHATAATSSDSRQSARAPRKPKGKGGSSVPGSGRGGRRHGNSAGEKPGFGSAGNPAFGRPRNVVEGPMNEADTALVDSFVESHYRNKQVGMGYGHGNSSSSAAASTGAGRSMPNQSSHGQFVRAAQEHVDRNHAYSKIGIGEPSSMGYSKWSSNTIHSTVTPPNERQQKKKSDLPPSLNPCQPPGWGHGSQKQQLAVGSHGRGIGRGKPVAASKSPTAAEMLADDNAPAKDALQNEKQWKEFGVERKVKQVLNKHPGDLNSAKSVLDDVLKLETQDMYAHFGADRPRFLEVAMRTFIVQTLKPEKALSIPFVISVLEYAVEISQDRVLPCLSHTLMKLMTEYCAVSGAESAPRRRRFCTTAGSFLTLACKTNPNGRLTLYLHSIILQFLNTWLESMADISTQAEVAPPDKAVVLRALCHSACISSLVRTGGPGFIQMDGLFSEPTINIFKDHILNDKFPREVRTMFLDVLLVFTNNIESAKMQQQQPQQQQQQQQQQQGQRHFPAVRTQVQATNSGPPMAVYTTVDGRPFPLVRPCLVQQQQQQQQQQQPMQPSMLVRPNVATSATFSSRVSSPPEAQGIAAEQGHLVIQPYPTHMPVPYHVQQQQPLNNQLQQQQQQRHEQLTINQPLGQQIPATAESAESTESPVTIQGGRMGLQAWEHNPSANGPVAVYHPQPQGYYVPNPTAGIQLQPSAPLSTVLPASPSQPVAYYVPMQSVRAPAAGAQYQHPAAGQPRLQAPALGTSSLDVHDGGSGGTSGTPWPREDTAPRNQEVTAMLKCLDLEELQPKFDAAGVLDSHLLQGAMVMKEVLQTLSLPPGLAVEILNFIAGKYSLPLGSHTATTANGFASSMPCAHQASVQPGQFHPVSATSPGHPYYQQHQQPQMMYAAPGVNTTLTASPAPAGLTA